MARHLRIVFLIQVILGMAAGSIDSIDNGVVNDPVIECAADSINVNFVTKNEFEGKIYIKGHVDEQGCKVGPEDANNRGGHTDNKKSFGIVVPFAKCGVSRRR